MSRAISNALTSSVSWRDYLELTKPRVVMLLMLTAIVGMFMSTPGMCRWMF